MDKLKKNKILYWLFTLPFALMMLGAAIAYLMNVQAIVETIAHLGYPPYFLKILGVAKLLGVIGIVWGRFYTLKEWAYAGFTFDFAAAFASHLFSGDPFLEAMEPVMAFGILMGSYIFWKRTSKFTSF